MATNEPQPLRQAQDAALQWALPEGLDVPPDNLRLRLDFYGQAILMHVIEDGVIQTRMVSAEEVSRTLARRVGVFSGFLPRDTVWWRQLPNGVEAAIWRRPQVTRVALQEGMFAPPRRFTVPMPGLLFLCSPGRPPWLWAVKRRPGSPEDILYHAPCFNVFGHGESCAGTHHYSQDPAQIPEEFFRAFFSRTGDYRGRSHRHPDDLAGLWEELDGKKRFPLDDLVEYGRTSHVLQRPYNREWR